MRNFFLKGSVNHFIGVLGPGSTTHYVVGKSFENLNHSQKILCGIFRGIFGTNEVLVENKK
eukprot:TRINITY_DN319_c0_g1_i2.p2 TRINITY_DN319_c0_g1~~TRINITY_DN319_c0_g1_i2.p2  ORF type:complete len:61 (+),score=3.92 TRINITY_DN319_c0_g1_i2:235-417(+)